MVEVKPSSFPSNSPNISVQVWGKSEGCGTGTFWEAGWTLSPRPARSEAMSPAMGIGTARPGFSPLCLLEGICCHYLQTCAAVAILGLQLPFYPGSELTVRAEGRAEGLSCLVAYDAGSLLRFVPGPQWSPWGMCTIILTGTQGALLSVALWSD